VARLTVEQSPSRKSTVVVNLERAAVNNKLGVDTEDADHSRPVEQRAVQRAKKQLELPSNPEKWKVPFTLKPNFGSRSCLPVE
jgi:hypothetical protein